MTIVFSVKKSKFILRAIVQKVRIWRKINTEEKKESTHQKIQSLRYIYDVYYGWGEYIGKQNNTVSYKDRQ